MKKWMVRIGQASMLLWTSTTLAWAEETTQQAAQAASSGSSAGTWFFIASVVAAAFGLGLAAFGGSLGQGNAVGKAVEGIARQPEAAAPIQTAMIIGISFIESLTIYALVVAIVLLFANPFLKFFTH